MEDRILQAVTAIRRHYDEPLSLDDLARVATMSKFHFLRSFRDHTDITPARYLTAVRIQAAKRLLHTTRLDVVDISTTVGYGSPGTFTTRFSECVGLSPVRYRRMVHGEALPLAGASDESSTPRAQYGTLSGTVRAARRTVSPIMLGLFPTRIPQGRPVACTVSDGPGTWSMPRVPVGTWHLLGVTVVSDVMSSGIDRPEDSPFLVAEPTIVHVRPQSRTRVNVALRSVRWTDPPLLIALPGVDAQIRAAA
jgi:AraC-like DNA-binding protein